MSALKQVMKVIDSHHISSKLLDSNRDKSGGLITNGQYAWFVSGANIILYSKQLGSVVSSRSFAGNQKDKSLKITYIKELKKDEETCNLILVGCSFKSSGIIFVCQLPTLTTIRCIDIPNPISYITTILNEPLAEDQLCDEFKIMSTILLVGMNTGAVYAVDLRHNYIEKQLRSNEIVVNELRPNKLFIVRKSEDCQEVKEMSDDSDSHLAIFLNENFYSYCKKQYSAKLNLKVSSLLYIEEINTIAIGYSTGHFQLWDCKIMRTIDLLNEPKCVMPITHINFLEPSDDPNNLCYLWIIQSDNTKLPNAMMIALTYEQRTVMPNGCSSYRKCQGSGVKLEMSLKRETGIGRCISALSLCNVNLFRNETDMDEDCEIKLFSMLMEVRQNVDADPESYVFLFDINQWYKAQMPSNINHLKVSNSYASFVKLPHNGSYLDFNISDKTLRPFGYNFRNNVEELYYPSSIYFECDCLVDTDIVRFKHAGVQQAILDELLLKSWKLLINPSIVFDQCIQNNLRPFFWDKTDDYITYSLPDQRSFVISILVENKIMSVLNACAEEWKNGTYASSEATILHLVQCLWKHVMVVKQYADKLCVPLFDFSGTRLDKKNKRILNHCLSQMQCVKHFLEDLHNAYGAQIINVDYSYRVYTLNLVTQYFKAVVCFLNYGLLPESIEQDPMQSLIQCDFTYLIQYANKRRMEFGDSQLYLIDAIVNNEPKGNKLIEQWLHEGGEDTKGMYPPSNVQCLLRIYLNAALSNQVKDFITIYFLFDVCSMKDLDIIVANRMCNFAIEFDVENKGLNALCRASWLLDHDMFENAMEILAANKEWKNINDKSWDWFHWVVLKLLVFKSEYFWARFYMKLINISIVDIDDHKFYINLQILNDQSFDAINYIRARPLKEKLILFDYFFDRCREINKLKCLIEYLWEKEEEELFYSYLSRFKDAESLTLQLLFLLQRGKYFEAIELNKSPDVINKLKLNDTLKLTSNLVNGFEKSIPPRKKSYERPQYQNLYKKRDIVVKCLHSDSKMFSILDRKKENNFEKRDSSATSSNLINLIIPANNNIRKRSPSHDKVCNEKRRKLNDNDSPIPPKADKEILRPIGKQVLDILNTPLVEKTIVSPSVTRYSSILKTGSTKKHKRVLSIKDDEIPVSKTVLRFSLPGEDDTKIVQSGPEKSTDMPNAGQESKSYSSPGLSKSITKQQSSIGLKQPHCDSSKMESILMTDESDNEDEKMDFSEYHEDEKVVDYDGVEVDDRIEKDAENKIIQMSENHEEIVLSSDDEEKEIAVSKSVLENTCYTLSDDSDNSVQMLPFSDLGKKTQQSVVIQKEKLPSPKLVSMNSSIVGSLEHNTRDNILNKTSRSNNVNISNSNDTDQVIENISDSDDDDDIIVFDSEDENAENRSSSIKSSDNCSVTDESDLEKTRYGRFKVHNSSEDIYEEVISDEEGDEQIDVEDDEQIDVEDDEQIYVEEDDEQIDVEQDDLSSVDNVSLEDEICSEDEIMSLEDGEEQIDLEQSDISDEDKSNNLKLQNDEYDEEGEIISSEDGEEKIDIDQSDISSEDGEEKIDLDQSDISSDEDKSNNLKLQNDEYFKESKIISLECGKEKINLEQSDTSSDVDKSNNLKLQNYEYDEENEIISSEDDTEKIDLEQSDTSSNENKSNNSKLQNDDYDEGSEKEDNNLKHDSLEIDEESEYENNSIDDCVVIDSESEEENNLKHDNIKFDDTNTQNDDVVPNIFYVTDSGENDSEQNDVHFDKDKENNSENGNDKCYDLSANEDCDLKSNSLENLTSCAFDLAEKNNQPNCNVELGNVETESYNDVKVVVDDEKIINSNIKENESYEEAKYMHKTSQENNSINYKEIGNNEICVNQIEDVGMNVQDECSFSNNDNYSDMPNRELSPIPDGGFSLPATEIAPNQLKMFEVYSNHSTPFLFGESYFGQQETPDNKPMLLFGQVYSSEKEKFTAASNINKSEVHDFVLDSDKGVIISNESEVIDSVDEIEDILELKSLPESNPDENSDLQKNLRTNNLQPEVTESEKTDDQFSIALNNSQKSIIINSENIDVIKISENQITEKSVESPSTGITKNVTNKKIESCNTNENVKTDINEKDPIKFKTIALQQEDSNISDSFRCESTNKTSLSENILHDDIKSQEKSETDFVISVKNKSISEIQDISVNQNLGINHIPEIISKDIKQMPFNPKQLIKTAVESKDIILQQDNYFVNEKTSEALKQCTSSKSTEFIETRSKKNKEYLCIKSQEKDSINCDSSIKNKSISEGEEILINQCLNIKHHIGTKDDIQVPYAPQGQPLISSDEKKRSRRSRSHQSYDYTNTLLHPFILLEKMDISDRIQKVLNNKEQLLVENTSKHENSHQESLKNNISKANDKTLDGFGDVMQITTQNIIKISDQTEESSLKISNSYIAKQIDENINNRNKRMQKAKSIPLQDPDIITTRSRAKSETNLLQLETDLPKDDNRQGGVSLSNKWSISQDIIASEKRRSRRSKSLAPIEESTVTRTAALSLEQKSIPLQDLDIITRSKAKNETNLVQLETNSPNKLCTSKIAKDDNRQVEVSLSNKWSTSQENIASGKRRSRRSKSLAPIEESTNTRTSEFSLEQKSIPLQDPDKITTRSNAKSETNQENIISEKCRSKRSKSLAPIEESTNTRTAVFSLEQKSIPLQVSDITTRSKAKSEINLVQLETVSPNNFRSSRIAKDNNRQVRVSLSNKRSKSQENIASAKRRSGRSKSLAPIEESVNIKTSVFTLEQIPEEETINSDKNIQPKHAALTTKSKFNFLSNISKLAEHENLNLNVQDKRAKTPRRSKSAQPDIALTFSMVKTKPKRSSSVNLLTSDGKNTTKTDDFMGVLKKALVSPIKIKKRSLTESVKSRKKQKITKQVNPDDFESDSNENLSDSDDQEFSPIAGNNSQHMLFTPVKRQTKIHMAALDSEIEVSSSESTDSKHIMTRSMVQNSSITELKPVTNALSTKKIVDKADENNSLLPKRGLKTTKETIVKISRNDEPSTPERRMTRSQKSILDKSLQSTSIIGQEEAIQNVPASKSEKRNQKKSIQKKSNN